MMWTVLVLLVLLVSAFLLLSIYRTRNLAAEAEKRVPMAGQVVPVAGGTIHYVEQGVRNGTPIVLIHGLSGQLQHFTYALTELLAKDYRVIAIDRPGCGYSTRDDEELSGPREQGQMIREALEKLNADNPVLVGHSLGGTIALAMALDHPDEVAALALISPATQHQDETPDVFRGLMITSPGLRRLISRTIAIPVAAAIREKLLSTVFHPEPVPDDFMIKAGGALGLRPQAFLTASLDAVWFQKTAKSITVRYKDELQVPGGILFGAFDTIVSPALHGHTMQAHGLSFEALDDRGHMLPLMAPDECADFIRRMAAKATLAPLGEKTEPALATYAARR